MSEAAEADLMPMREDKAAEPRPSPAWPRKGASCLIEAHRHLVPVGEFVEVEESAGNGGPRGEIGR